VRYVANKCNGLDGYAAVAFAEDDIAVELAALAELAELVAVVVVAAAEQALEALVVLAAASSCIDTKALDNRSIAAEVRAILRRKISINTIKLIGSERASAHR